MNTDYLTQLLHQSFRVTLGATASFVETLQDPAKRTENIAQINSELSQLAADWAVKGEVTEQEARNFVEHLLHQRSSSTPESYPKPDSEPTVVASPEVQLQLQELTAQLAAMRAELEMLRNQDSDPA